MSTHRITNGRIISTMAGIGVSLGAMLLVKVYTPLAWTWYVLVGTVICVTVGYAVSAAFPTAGRPEEC